jgi:hypothetical protein
VRFDDLPPGVRDAPTFFDRCGNPIGMGRWMDLHHDISYKRVRWTHVGSWEVSTVWLGIDHGFIGPPLIFETMVFEQAESNGYMGPALGLDGGGYVYHESFDEYTSRYSTEGQAIAGHEATVREVRPLFLPAVIA